MSIKKIITPNMGESITEATVVRGWFREGASFSKDDTLFEIETEKVNLVISAESAGVIQKLFVKEGDVISPGTILGEYEERP